MDFRLDSQYKPTGDQPEAIAQLSKGVLEGLPAFERHVCQVGRLRVSAL